VENFCTSIVYTPETHLDLRYPTLGLHQSNIDIMQCFENKALRNMVNSPWYVRNNDLHRDLQVNVVSSEIQRFAQNMKGGFTIKRTLRPYCCWTTRA